MAPKNGIEVIDSDDDGDDDMDEVTFDEKENGEKNQSESEPRVRQYPDTNKGPFVVCIRAINTPLESTRLTKYIRKRYTADINIRQINEFKLRVVFADKKPEAGSIKKLVTIDEARRQANSLPNCELYNKKYRIYIPEKLVETMGCIAWSCSESENDLIEDGEGKFKNVLLPSVKILDAIRFEKIVDGSENRIKTGVVRVTFAGLVLPDYVCLYGLLIPVREFKRRQMFCTSCLSYNHTQSHCNNKARTAVPIFKCVHCKTNDHNSGDKRCPRRKFLEKRENERAKNFRQKTFAEMLQTFDPNATMPGEEYGVEFPPLRLGTKRERNQLRHENILAEEISPTRKRSRSNLQENASAPPGFRNPNHIELEDDDITAFMRSIITELELPPFMMQLCLKYAVPFIVKLIHKFTNTVLSKMSQVGSM